MTDVETVYLLPKEYSWKISLGMKITKDDDVLVNNNLKTIHHGFLAIYVNENKIIHLSEAIVDIMEHLK